MNALPELIDKKIGCFCAPKTCHGDVLVELVHDLLESKRFHSLF